MWRDSLSGIVNVEGVVEGIVLFRVVGFWLGGMEVGQFSISCRFKNCKDGF